MFLFSLAFPKIVIAVDEEERKFGYYADRVTVAGHTILFNDKLNKRINEIGSRVAKVSGEPDLNYTFRIINNPVINAYAAAGGFVYINTGLLDILQSEDELAALIAHEIGHISKSHQINFLRSAQQKQMFAKGLSFGIKIGLDQLFGRIPLFPVPSPNIPPGAMLHNLFLRQLLGGISAEIGEGIANAMALSMVKGYRKEQELEADILAIQYTKKAGYDPNAMISVFKRLIKERDRLGINENNYVSHFINADPGLDERLKKAEELILSGGGFEERLMILKRLKDKGLVTEEEYKDRKREILKEY